MVGAPCSADDACSGDSQLLLAPPAAREVGVDSISMRLIRSATDILVGVVTKSTGVLGVACDVAMASSAAAKSMPGWTS